MSNLLGVRPVDSVLRIKDVKELENAAQSPCKDSEPQIKKKYYQGAIKVKTPTRKKVGWPADFLSSGMMRFTRALCSEINPRRPSLRRHQGLSGSARNQGECPALPRYSKLSLVISVITVGGSFILFSTSSWEVCAFAYYN